MGVTLFNMPPPPIIRIRRHALLPCWYRVPPSCFQIDTTATNPCLLRLDKVVEPDAPTFDQVDYQLVVTATDIFRAVTATTTLQILIVLENDNNPVFSNTVLTVSVRNTSICTYKN